MPKTITVRVDDTTYKRIKNAADSERRTISNFIEYATLAYVENSSFVTDEEMKGIAEDTELINNLKMSLEDIKSGKYRIVE
ncbi:MAG: CopG family transcriptional regulator [Chloroflexi bacterium RBG_16_51_9]|nr:MAG: CopG family transcriptional regulator [Chloroflexi bacterium RBG_16_51_9]